MEVVMERLYHGLLLRAPQRSLSGLYAACIIRTPIIRFEMRRVRGRPTQHLTLRQNWVSDKGDVIPFPVKQDWGLESHWKHMLEDTWTLDVLPALRKRGFDEPELFVVQVLHPSGREPFVRFNQEVRVRPSLLLCREAPTWLYSIGRLSESGFVFGFSPELCQQLLGATSRVIDLQLLDDERTRYGHFTCLRIGDCWQGVVDLVGLLPESMQHRIEAWERSPLSRSIISSAYGDDSAKDELLRRQNIDRYSLPWPLNEEMPNLVYASVYRTYDNTPVQQMPSVISHCITEELTAERESLDWDRFLDYPDRLAVSPNEASELKQATERYCIATGLGRKKQAIIKLNVILECRNEKWTRQQKAGYLNMGVKNYEKQLGHTRTALRLARRKQIPEGYKRLLDEILKGG